MNITQSIKNNIPPTSERVPLHTKPEVNERIRRQANERLEDIGDDRAKIEARLAELDREWDIERAIEANASTVILIGSLLGATVNKRFFALPAIVAGFLFQHSIQGWCPPVPALRRLGFRTQREIDDERMILLARLGTFENVL